MNNECEVAIAHQFGQRKDNFLKPGDFRSGKIGKSNAPVTESKRIQGSRGSGNFCYGKEPK
jgi:hypothetical protein